MLPRRTLDEVIEAFPTHRQSTLGTWDNCFLTTKFDLEGSGYSNHAQARGTIFHAFAAEVLRTLRRTGETVMPTEEAMAILYEVAAQRDMPDDEVVVVPLVEQRLIRIAAIRFVSEQQFDMRRLIDVERRLYADVTYPHPQTGAPVTRTITGRPDAIVADPGMEPGLVVPDWKLWRQPPPKYRGEHVDGHGRTEDNVPAGVSYMGYFQQRSYAFLCFHNFPHAQRVITREYYPLAREGDKIREAVVHREQLEHIERELATLVELLDRALMGGSASPIWNPSPGAHCGYCARPNQCPIGADERVFNGGGIATPEDAARYAAEFVQLEKIKPALREALKSWVQVYGQAAGLEDDQVVIPVKNAKGRSALGWRTNKTGEGRKFGVFVPDESDRGPDDEKLRAAFESAAGRRR